MPNPSSPATGPALLAEQEIQYVCNLAEHCGKIAKDMRQSVGVKEKAPHDLVTDADLAVSEILLAELGKRFPHDFMVSEEAVPEIINFRSRGIWYIDPIDGTDNYVNGDGQYAVMIGLLVGGRPHFGCVYAPAHGVTYYGGPNYGAWVREKGAKSAVEFKPNFQNPMGPPVRLMMGSRDKLAHPWVKNLPGSKLISAGSVGLKVAKVINDEADLFVHLSGKLKYWDTVGPVAIALAAGLEAGTLDYPDVPYPLQEVKHQHSIIIGRKGSLSWSRTEIGSRFFG